MRSRKLKKNINMPKKCSIPNSHTNYRDRTECVPTSNEKIPVFRFPGMNDGRDTWISHPVQKNLTIGKDSVISEKHWPESYRKISKKGRQRPNEPPSIFPGVSKSYLPKPTAKLRTTKKSSLEILGTQPDKMELFRQRDKVSFNEVVTRTTVKNHSFCCPTTAFLNGPKL